MLRWALTFLVLALAAAFVGFSGAALVAAGIAKLLLILFVALLIASLIAHYARA
jgi:uncharacterized membrane protein YtjA (UPF0391 family)